VLVRRCYIIDSDRRPHARPYARTAVSHSLGSRSTLMSLSADDDSCARFDLGRCMRSARSTNQVLPSLSSRTLSPRLARHEDGFVLGPASDRNTDGATENERPKNHRPPSTRVLSCIHTACSALRRGAVQRRAVPHRIQQRTSLRYNATHSATNPFRMRRHAAPHVSRLSTDGAARHRNATHRCIRF